MKHYDFKVFVCFGILAIFLFIRCSNNKFTEAEKTEIFKLIKLSIDEGVRATQNKDINLYMKNIPKDLLIYDETGTTITRKQQREYALRDWSIIDKTLSIEVKIDSIDFVSKDSIHVYTSQRWERIMFQRDGVATDTVLTTQKHKEIWKPTSRAWLGYTVEELGGQIFVNGETYNQ